MSIPQTFYMDGPSLGSSTSIFVDANLTTCAPNGFYSDGVIVRQQTSCSLLPPQACPSCSVLCGDPITASGLTGEYLLNVNTGETLGAIVIRFNPLSIPDGIMATFNTTIYNELSSPLFGYLAAPVNLPTFVGNFTDDCGIGGSTFTLDEYLYDGVGFNATGNSNVVNVSLSQVHVTSTAPGECVMIIPKTAASPSIINIQVFGVCGGTAFNIQVDCPVMLTSFPASLNGGLMPGAEFCSLATDSNYYSYPLNGSPGILGLYDWVFTDIYGENKLANGWYKYDEFFPTYDSFHVENGVVIAFGTLCS